MARKNKYPDLQEKFEKGLTNNMKAGVAYSGRQLLDFIINNKVSLKIVDEEIDDLKKNFANYIYRAVKERGIVQSLGNRKGYLISNEVLSTSEEVSATEIDAKRRSWESFLHFIATFILSKEFNAKITSLPQKTTKLKWANPDMIMVRDNWFNTNSNFKSDLNSGKHDFAELISKFDSSPKNILSSIELKFNLGENRNIILNALTETAINGGWANENWLIYMNDFNSQRTEFDADAIDFARKNNIGIIELSLSDDSRLSLRKILKTENRNYLSFINTDGKKTLLLDKITKVIEDFDEKGSFRDANGGYYIQTSELIFQAFENLKVQSGFSKDPLKKLNEYLLQDKKIKKSILELLQDEGVDELKSDKDFLKKLTDEISKSSEQSQKKGAEIKEVINCLK